MQFSLVAILAALATSVAAAPTLFTRQDTCDITSCVLDLAPSVVTCGSAVAQAAVDPVSDVSCLIAAAKDVTEFPPSCNGCLQQFGVSTAVAGAATTVETAVTGGLSSLGSDISGLF
ncbi:hypothetical protein B0H11DRAFT_2269339 [Mycena galericulata]|nr:hypothetical protein B0H11DRAFT_2269339 [Mycena galericulata]